MVSYSHAIIAYFSRAMPELSDSIQFVQGVGPKRAEVLASELGIHTVADLLYYYPYKYVDRTKFYKINELNTDQAYIQLRGRLENLRQAGGGRAKRLTAELRDETGRIELVWFKGLKWMQKSLLPGQEYVAYGKPAMYGRKLNMAHPELELAKKHDAKISSSLEAHYSTTEKLRNSYISSKTFRNILGPLLNEVGEKIWESLPAYLVKELKLMGLRDALMNIHFPSDAKNLERARYRLKFEELFYVQLHILRQKTARQARYKGFVFGQVGDKLNTFYKKHLPFELTGAQKRVIREIRHDLGSGQQMNRLLQGDVGSGKTLVALMSMLIALDNGYQACMMAPTEVLATQHLESLTELLEGTGISVALLKGSTKKTERKALHEKLRDGKLEILIGTHALIEDVVQFHKLGLVIIDEQHRFGVAQRARLWQKSDAPPHVLVMTATPIPRTLAMTVYGDLDVSVIDEMPPGRKAIETMHYFENKRLRLFGFIREQIKKGRQIYIVFPLIEESENFNYKDLKQGVDNYMQAFPPPDYSIAVVHGRMKPEEKDYAMQFFQQGKAQIMIATTVIEVGINVPNASVMVIESAQRFGLSQLHQLRGRVGRGADQSYCLLMTEYELSKEARQRIEIMCRTNDGFEIAEADMKLRGPGDIEGTQQSGIPFDLRIANLAKDNQLLLYARQVAEKILDADPKLENDANALLRKQLKKRKQAGIEWSDIS